MTQETAYGSLLMSRRRELHKHVADYLERKAPESVNDMARHFMEAREEARALPYLVESGDIAARAYATADAIASYRQALDVLENIDDVPLARRAYEGLGGALTFAFDVPAAVENYHKMVHVAEEYGDLPMQVSALNKLGFVAALMMDQFPEAEEHLVDAERLAYESGDEAGLAEMHMTYCYLRSTKGEFEDAADHLGQAARIGRELDLEEPKALTIPHYHIRNGDLDTARQSAVDGVALGLPIGAMDEVCDGELALGQIAWLRGEYEGAIGSQRRALDAARATGMSYLQAVALCQLGVSLLDVSLDFSEQVTQYHMEAMKLMETPLGTALGAISWADVGFCAMELGKLDVASEMFQKGMDHPTMVMHMLRPKLLTGLAWLALAQNKTEEFASGARGLAEAAGMKQYSPLIALTDARVSASRGDTEAALAAYLRAEDLALQMGMRPLAWQARAGAAWALSMLDRVEEASDKRRETLAMIDEIAGLFEDQQMRDQFAAAAASKLKTSFDWEDAAALRPR